MKTYFISFAIVLAATNAFAELNKSRVISERTVAIDVDISTAKVRLSRAGYSTEVVKVLIPALADVTLLDHRNEGESAPCLATNATDNPADVVQNNPSVESIQMKITLTKFPTINSTTQLCDIILSESIETKIRGFSFDHFRSLVIASRSIDDCR